MRVQVTPEGYQYRCDACGHYHPRVWLFRGRLHCPDCYPAVRLESISERNARAVQLSRYLVEKSK